MPYIVLTDSCFWLGLLDSADQYHDNAVAISQLILNQQIVLPWCCLFEIIATRLTRHRDRIVLLESFLSQPNIVLFDDEMYKQNALQQVFSFNRLGFTYSLTDGVIREILKDINVNVNFLATFNNRDFEDVCQLRQIEILSQ